MLPCIAKHVWIQLSQLSCLESSVGRAPAYSIYRRSRVRILPKAAQFLNYFENHWLLWVYAFALHSHSCNDCVKVKVHNYNCVHMPIFMHYVCNYVRRLRQSRLPGRGEVHKEYDKGDCQSELSGLGVR